MLPIAPVNAITYKPRQVSSKALATAAIAVGKATENPPAAVVTAIQPSERARRAEHRRRPRGPSPVETNATPDPDAETPEQGTSERHPQIATETRSVMLQAIGERTGEVILRVPTETFLRIRAFGEAADAPRPKPAKPTAD